MVGLLSVPEGSGIVVVRYSSITRLTVRLMCEVVSGGSIKILRPAGFVRYVEKLATLR